MKKCLALGMAMTLAMSTLMACGGDSSDNTKTADNAKTENPNNGGSDITADNGETYKMVMEIINYGFDDPDLGMVQDAVNEITVPEIGVEVQFMTVPIGEMSSKLGLLVSGGEQIDLVVSGLLTTPANLMADGLLQSITQYVENSDALMELAGQDIEACKVNGEIYAYPGATANGTQTVYYYDKDLAEQYNIQVPEKLETSQDWEALFKQIKDSGMEQYAISMGDGVAAEDLWATFDSLGERSYLAYGVVMDPFNGDTVENYYATEQYAEVCRMHREWYEKGYCVPDSISNGYTVSDSMTQGAIFGFVSANSTGMNTAYWSKITGKNLGYIPTTDISTMASGVVNFSWGVSVTCERPDKVVDFLELLYTNTDLANIMNYGIEGTHYVVNEGSKIIGYPDGVDATNCGYGSFAGTYGDTLSIYQRAPLTDEEVANFVQFKTTDESASKFLGYTFDPSEVSTAVTAVTAVIGQYAPSLNCGTVDPEKTIPEFLDALEAAGMQTIIDANQAQLNAYLEQK